MQVQIATLQNGILSIDPGLIVQCDGKGDRRSQRSHLLERVVEAVKSGTLPFAHTV